MRVLDCKISTRIQAKIKVSWLKQEEIDVPINHVMYMFSEPENWDVIDKQKHSGQTIQEFSEIIRDNLDNNNQSFAELLLKVAGKHPNEMENVAIQSLIRNRRIIF